MSLALNGIQVLTSNGVLHTSFLKTHFTPAVHQELLFLGELSIANLTIKHLQSRANHLGVLSVTLFSDFIGLNPNALYKFVPIDFIRLNSTLQAPSAVHRGVADDLVLSGLEDVLGQAVFVEDVVALEDKFGVLGRSVAYYTIQLGRSDFFFDRHDVVFLVYLLAIFLKEIQKF